MSDFLQDNENRFGQAKKDFQNMTEQTTQYEKVNKHTRCRASKFTFGSAGRLIICPHCSRLTNVHHFSWSALQCGGCEAMVDKLCWLLADSHGEKR
jgi:hypothetical protein